MTDREQDALNAIDEFRRNHPYAPSFRDIQEALGLASVSSAYRILSRLRDRGLIEWEQGHFRTIRRSNGSTAAGI